MNETERIISDLCEQKNYWKMRYKLNGDEDSNKYVTVIDMAIKALEDNIKLNKQNEEIQNNNIEHYIRAKDAEDRCKTTEKQNKRLKELLKLAFEEIYKISELNEDVCFMECDSCNDCSFVYEETGICKWKHADEVEEVLKDE